MKVFEYPEIETQKLAVDDVITTSTCETDNDCDFDTGF